MRSARNARAEAFANVELDALREECIIDDGTTGFFRGASFHPRCTGEWRDLQFLFGQIVEVRDSRMRLKGRAYDCPLKEGCPPTRIVQGDPFSTAFCGASASVSYIGLPNTIPLVAAIIC